MCGGLFRDDRPPAVQLPQLPPETKWTDVIDFITGVESVTVRHNGTDRREIRSLPRSPEEEIIQTVVKDLMVSAINGIKTLRQTNPTSVVPYQPFINELANINNQRIQELSMIADFGNIKQDIADFKNIRQANLDREFLADRNNFEREMSQAGRGKSTDATEGRRAMARENSLARNQIDVESQLYGDQLASNRLALNAGVFDLNEQGRGARAATAQERYILQQQEQDDIRKLREDEVGILQTANSLDQQELQKRLSSIAPQLQNDIYQMQASNSMARYTADLSRAQAQNNIDIQRYNSRPMSLMDFALKAGGTAAGAYLGGPVGASIGSQLGDRRGGGGGMSGVGRMTNYAQRRYG